MLLPNVCHAKRKLSATLVQCKDGKPERHEFGMLDDARRFAAKQFKLPDVHAHAIAHVLTCPLTAKLMARAVDGRQK